MLHPIPAKPITVQVPDKLYRRLTQRAQQTRRTVEDELLDAAVGGLPLNDELPPDLEDEIQLGRATVVALHLNRSALVLARSDWVAVGWHPPGE
jgi:hypothetical protein